jgi:pseudouridine synthase
MIDGPKPERLHKVLAHAGVASRRRCEDLIREGRVRVNGEIVREMGVRVDLASDVVEVDDERVRPERPVYLLVYKPRGYLCTTSDQWGRKTILDLLPKERATRLFTVGRLDFDAEGLVVVTNDGDFAHDVLHPRRRLPRTYYLKVHGSLTDEAVRRAREGVWLSDGRTPPMDVRVERIGREVSAIKCTVVERHHHQLKRIWAKLGVPVTRIVLVRIASIGTEDLSKGHWRSLRPEEVRDLRSGEPGRLAAAPRRSGTKRPAEAWGAPARRADAPRPSDGPRRMEGPRRREGSRQSDGPRRSAAGPRDQRRPSRLSSSGRRSRKRGR